MSLKLPKDDYRNKDRTCNVCNKTMPITSFAMERCNKSHNKISVRNQCRPCMEFRKYKAFIKKTYGVTWEDYQEMFDNQKGCCAICKSKVSSSRTTRLFIDHCHSTTRVRGLLCSACNHGLGLFKDSPTLLKRAINYLDSDKE